MVVNGVAEPAQGAINSVANQFSCHHTTISRIWRKAKKNRVDPDVLAYRASPEHHKCGRKRKYDEAELAEAIKAVPVLQKRSERALSAALGIPKMTLHHYKVRDDIIRPESNCLKPLLNPLHKEIRMACAFSRVVARDLAAHGEFGAGNFGSDERCCDDLVFDSADNEVHIDEKWFFITEHALRVHLAKGEKSPMRTVPNKNSIIKVMSICAIARPRFDSEGRCTFDGKIGIWPFVETRVTQRSSKNRPAGTKEKKSITVDGPTHKKYVLKKVLPAIRRRWPDKRATIRIQHDNARLHFGPDDSDWVRATSGTPCIKFVLVEQGANLPDNNVLDLGFFHPLQNLQWQQPPATTINGLIKNVNAAFAQYNPKLLDRNWLTHQSVMDCVLQSDGDNNYKVPHLNKDRMQKRGNLPRHLPLTRLAKQHLERAGFL